MRIVLIGKKLGNIRLDYGDYNHSAWHKRLGKKRYTRARRQETRRIERAALNGEYDG